MRTTLDIDEPILAEVKAMRDREGGSLGRVVSDLLAEGLRARRESRKKAPARRWITRRMAARVDLADTDALYAAMERDRGGSPERPDS
jgi:hypothetical protein